MPIRRYTLGADERLKSRKVLEEVIKGSAHYHYPLRMLFVPLAEGAGTNPALVAFSVPKRLFKKAVVRNRIKRRLREAYRLAKPELYDKLSQNGIQYAILFVYVGREEVSWLQIREVIKKLLFRILSDDSKPD